MHSFKYVLTDSAGFKVRGSIEAENKEKAIENLPPHDSLISIKDQGRAIEVPERIATAIGINRVKSKDLGMFLEQLASMLHSEIPISKALSMLSKGKTNIAKFSGALLLSVNEGKSLSDAMIDNSVFLKKDIIGLVYSGQQSGNLEETLIRIAKQIKANGEIISKVKGALTYPVIVVAFAAIASLFLFTTIVPQMTGTLKEMGSGELPALTMIVLGISDTLMTYGIYLLILTVIIVYAVIKIVKKFFMLQFHRIMIKTPLVGNVVRYWQCIVFFQNLGFMLDAGFTTAEALKTSMMAITNLYVRKCLDTANSAVLDGESLGKALMSVSIFKEVEIRTIEVGASTGDLAKLIESLTDRMKKDSTDAVDMMLKTIEPAIMVVVGAVVCVILLAVYTPMFTMMG